MCPLIRNWVLGAVTLKLRLGIRLRHVLHSHAFVDVFLGARSFSDDAIVDVLRDIENV